MDYQHQLIDGTAIDLPVGKVVCVGRNYAAHARELNNPVPVEPLFFIKPATSLRLLASAIELPEGRGEVHYEMEMAILVGKTLTECSVVEGRAGICGVGLGLDLTLRDLQDRLKAKGHPWEKAKAFDGACPLSPFVAMTDDIDLSHLELELRINGAVRQSGTTADMLFSPVDLLVEISSYFTLQPGDVVLTGTPAGVGALNEGDKLQLSLADLCRFEASVA